MVYILSAVRTFSTECRRRPHGFLEHALNFDDLCPIKGGPRMVS